MKKFYLKPITEIIISNIDKNILVNHSEPEITSNIGTNENNTFEDINNDNNIEINLWEE